jgi:hypothetical protein
MLSAVVHYASVQSRPWGNIDPTRQNDGTLLAYLSAPAVIFV